MPDNQSREIEVQIHISEVPLNQKEEVLEQLYSVQ